MRVQSYICSSENYDQNILLSGPPPPHPAPVLAESKLTGYYFLDVFTSLDDAILIGFWPQGKKNFIALNRIALHAWLQDSPEKQVIMVFNSGIKENWKLKIWVGIPKSGVQTIYNYFIPLETPYFKFFPVTNM